MSGVSRTSRRVRLKADTTALSRGLTDIHLAPNLDLVSRALAEIDRLRGRLRDLESELQSLHDEAAKIPGRLTDVRNDLADLEAKAAGLLSDVLRMTCVDACDKQPLLRQECKDECNKALNAANRLIFRQDASGKGLLRFDRVSRRIDADMAAQDGRFNSDCTIGSKCFHAAYNAVVLAKLTLLDGPTLNALVSQVLGKPYDRYSGGPGAILRRGVRNIDGNHQWQQKAPPFFRVDGSHPPEGQFREFGYPLTPEGGFQLWSPDDDVRNRVFLRIFRGPVAPALENPCASEFPDVVHPSYKYRTCSAKPFADSTAPTGVACQSARITDLTFLHDETGFEWTKVQVRVENSGPRASRKRLRTDILSADSPTATKGGVIAFVEDMRLPQICDGESRDVVMWLDLPPLDPGRYHVVTTITDGKNVDSVQRATRTIDVAPCKQRYKIKEGETLHAIAKQFEMGVWKIAGRNRIYDLNAIQAGQTICIP